MRYTPLELLEHKILKLFHERDGSMNEQTNERTYERKEENYIPLGINAVGIITVSPELFFWGGGNDLGFTAVKIISLIFSRVSRKVG